MSGSALMLLLLLLLGALARGELVFRCPGCTAEQQAACPKPSVACVEIVREPGCGCCPVCARQEGELCGVYTPRCGNGLRCYPSPDAELPLKELVDGLGQCRRRVEGSTTDTHDYRDIYSEYVSGEILGTKAPVLKKPTKDASYWHIRDMAIRHHQNEQRTRMIKRVDEPKTPRPRQNDFYEMYMKVDDREDLNRTLEDSSRSAVVQSQCQQELDKVLEEISKMTFHDNRGPLENLYDLKFPNCDKKGQYNIKQCHMSTHGQRGECWCVNPHTGIQIPSSIKVRGDPNCSQYYGGLELEPPIGLQK